METTKWFTSKLERHVIWMIIYCLISVKFINLTVNKLRWTCSFALLVIVSHEQLLLLLSNQRSRQFNKCQRCMFSIFEVIPIGRLAQDQIHLFEFSIVLNATEYESIHRAPYHKWQWGATSRSSCTLLCGLCTGNSEGTDDTTKAKGEF